MLVKIPCISICLLAAAQVCRTSESLQREISSCSHPPRDQSSRCPQQRLPRGTWRDWYGKPSSIISSRRGSIHQAIEWLFSAPGICTFAPGVRAHFFGLPRPAFHPVRPGPSVPSGGVPKGSSTPSTSQTMMMDPPTEASTPASAASAYALHAP